MGVILGLYLGLFRDNGKENGNYYIIIGYILGLYSNSDTNGNSHNRQNKSDNSNHNHNNNNDKHSRSFLSTWLADDTEMRGRCCNPIKLGNNSTANNKR